MSGTYAKRFAMRLEYSVDLQDPAYREYLKSLGFCWVRPRRTQSWAASLRSPTVGSYVEVLTGGDLWADHMDSSAGLRLIWSLASRN